jgi:two-component system, NarL family, response regulator YdfI
MTRVFIVAASPLTRAGLQDLLAARGVRVVGSSANLESLSEQFTEAKPHAVLLDVSGEKTPELLDSSYFSELVLETAVVVLSDHPPPGWVAEALRAGVRAILPSDVSPGRLISALQAAVAGLVVLHPSDVGTALAPAAPVSHPVAELVEPLTRREREVLQMLASGLGNKEIAASLSISDHTVKFHVASILGKLGASSRTEAVSLGIRHGLVLL